VLAEFFIIWREVLVNTGQLQAAEGLSQQTTMNDKSSFDKVPLVISKQLISYALTILQEYQLIWPGLNAGAVSIYTQFSPALLF
jgi:hypothetical protein